MTGDADARLIAKGLRFLAAGFEMAGKSGVSGTLRRIDGGESRSPYAAGLPKAIRATCNVDRLHLDRFRARMPADFLVESIGRGISRTSVTEEPGSVHATSGMAARDGSETYLLRHVDLTFWDVPDGFAMEVTMRLGEPVRDTFVHAAPVERSHESYQAAFEVPWRELFRFLFPVTREQAAAVTERIHDQFGIRIDMPAFYVNK